MGNFANRMRDVAARLLTKRGQLVYFRRNAVSDFTPETGTVSNLPSIPYSGYGQPTSYSAFNIDNTVIKQGDIKLVMYSSDVPLLNDIFTIDNKEYTALDVNKIKTEGTDIVYIIQLRQ